MEDDWFDCLLPKVIYDAGGDVEGFFPMEFRKYVQEQNLLCSTRANYGNPTEKYFLFQNTNETSYADVVTSDYHLIAIELTRFIGYFYPQNCLVQFWRANSGNDFGDRLTTRNQPFLVTNKLKNPISEGLCWYRMRTHDVGDGRGEAISRVFKNKRMEFSPNVEYYSYEEYPQRDIALSCLIKGSLIGPLSDSYGRTIGVIEFVSQSDDCPLKFWDGFLSTLPKSGLVYLDPCEGLCGQYDLDKDSLRSAVSEIKKVIDVVRRSLDHDIVTAQTWMLCKHCNSLSTSEKCAKELGASYQRFFESVYVKFGSYCILREGEGVVGRAAMSSHNLVYCENIAKLSITEYPLAHFVRKEDIQSASFAICLQSNHSGDQVYVLEFFLGPNYGNWGLGKKLVPILDKMRQCFRTFKVAYGGEEIGENLSVLVVDASSPDKVETLIKESIDLTLAIGVKNVEAYHLQQSIGESSGNETEDPMIGVETSFQDISMDDVPVASASTVQSEICVTVKANYGGDFIRFQLSASSGIHELHRQVFQKLELEVDTYLVQYQDDDNDWIIIACDEDLQEFISTSHENFTLVMSIEPKRASPM